MALLTLLLYNDQFSVSKASATEDLKKCNDEEGSCPIHIYKGPGVSGYCENIGANQCNLVHF